MASFEIAMSWLRQGHKIARPNWEKGSYWRIVGDKTERIVWSDGEKAGVHLKQIEARDWQIYVERPDIQKMVRAAILEAARKEQKRILKKYNLEGLNAKQISGVVELLRLTVKELK